MSGPTNAAGALRFDFARAWREPPTMATSTTLRYSSACFLVLGGVLLMVCTPFMPGSPSHHLHMVLSAVPGVALGGVCYAVGHHLPRWFFESLVVLAIVMVTGLVHSGPSALDAVCLGAGFMMPVVVAALQLTLRGALLAAILAAVCCAWSLGRSGAPAGDIMLVEGCVLSMTAMVAWLARVADVAEEDPLTGLTNRRGLKRRLEEELQRLDRDGGQFSLVALDIDCFKKVNDSFGHLYGDRVLVECAAAWCAELPDGAVLSRYGGDEFILILPDTPLGRAADITDRLRAVAAQGVTISAGVAPWQYGDSGSMLLNRADVALYDAKSCGRDRTVAYGDPGREASELETAIANGEMRVLLQPVVRLPDGEPIGFEALIRWERPGRGLVGSLDFVPQAERTGAIHSLGAWMLRECCRLAMTLPGPRRSIGVNASVHELRRADYAQTVGQLLDEWQMPGELLIIEVTESVFEDDDPQVSQTLHDLRALGALVAIDDFGAGYSSLRRIEHLPIDLIKVDGALVCSIRENQDPAILRAIVTMAESLGVNLVAEHVETDYQAAVLHELGYDLAQGYRFGRPTTPEEAARTRTVPVAARR